MIDFTSALYLGMKHASGALPRWDTLTEGVPAALRVARAACRFERELAALQGREACLAMTSTLHAFWDLVGWLANPNAVMLADAGAYTITWWGLERARARGVPVLRFRHNDAKNLRELLARYALCGSCMPVVFIDGSWPDDGCVAPYAEMLAIVRERGGLLVADDTQALGVLGHGPSRMQPYGSGGGGSMRWLGLDAPDVITVASCAKAFGVPIAAVSGAQSVIAALRTQAHTRVHSSPPSNAHLSAALAALALNRSTGDALRARLLRNVLRLRERLRAAGIQTSGGLFPVQTLDLGRFEDPVGLFGALERRGISTVLRRPLGSPAPRLSLIVTAAHEVDEIEFAAAQIQRTLCHARRARRRLCECAVAQAR
jgi:8-amino-7-oxononanoate synthase